MGEQVHTELHQPQQQKARSYPPNRKANLEETKNFPGEVQEQVERYNNNPQEMFDPQRYQPMIKANNRFIMENSRGYENQGWYHARDNGNQRFEEYPMDDLRVLRGPMIKANNRLIVENSRGYENQGRYHERDGGNQGFKEQEQYHEHTSESQ